MQHTFKDGRYMTAAEKQAVYKKLSSFVAKGFPRNLFTRAVYKYMHLGLPFIAHYDIDGFYSARFADPHGRIQTLQTIASAYLTEEYADLTVAVKELFAAYADNIAEQAARDRVDYLQDLITQAQSEIATITGPQPLRLVRGAR